MGAVSPDRARRYANASTDGYHAFAETERSRLLLKQSSSLQLVGRIILVAILVLLAIWILRRFLPALAWAGVLAIATWPVRECAAGVCDRMPCPHYSIAYYCGDPAFFVRFSCGPRC